MVGGSITALEQEDRNLPGWPRYQADKWSFSSDLGGTTEYNFRPLGTEVFLLLSLLFCKLYQTLLELISSLLYQIL